MHFLWIVELIALATGIYSFRDVHVVSRSSQAGIENARTACTLLNEALSGLVAYPGSAQYDEDISHPEASSQENATCSIEPASIDDVSTIIMTIGSERAPFAVKSGGHAYNLNFSSTPGVQISMSNFNNISYDDVQSTVSLGVGLTWDQAYEALEPLGVMVAGGRINGVGVGGLSLGGGYSWKTNQYGLTVDTIVSFELVLPSGDQLVVTNFTNPDLFFALKGGLNNYGIVTNIVFEAHPQTLVFGGAATYSADFVDAFSQAINRFAMNNSDPKAQLVATYSSTSGQMSLGVLLFYDGPIPPPGVFDEILAIPNVTANISTRTFYDFMSTTGNGDMFPGPEGMAQHTVPILNYPISVLNEMSAQVDAFGNRLHSENPDIDLSLSMSPEPFLSAFAHSKGGAYPHSPSRPVTPSSMSIIYQTPNTSVTLEEQENRQAGFVTVLKEFADKIQAKAVSEGVSAYDDIKYPNYALYDTPLKLLYGDNVPRLKEIAARFDPDRVMTLTGGFKLSD